MKCRNKQPRVKYCLGDFRHYITIYKSSLNPGSFAQFDPTQDMDVLGQVYAKIEDYTPPPPGINNVNGSKSQATHKIIVNYDLALDDLMQNSAAYYILDERQICYKVVAQPQNIDNDSLYIKIYATLRGDVNKPANMG